MSLQQFTRGVWALAASCVLLSVGSVAAADEEPDESAAAATEEDSTDPVPGADEEVEVPFVDPPTEEVPSVAMGELEPGFQEASEQLEKNFSGFLEREPLGFDFELVELLRSDVEVLYAELHSHLTSPGEATARAVVDITIVLVVIALFLVLFFLIDRFAVNAAHRIQARIHFDVSVWLTKLARKAVVVAGRAIALTALIALSYFPVRAVFGSASWTLLLTDVLLFSLLYRVAKSTVLTALRLEPRNDETKAHFARVETFAMAVLRFTLATFIALAAIERFEYHAQFAELVSFGFRLGLVAVTAGLFWMRDDMMALLPPDPQSRLYLAVYTAIDRYYLALIAVTVILLLFNAAGFTNAATFLLTRGYAVIVIAAIWFAILERIHHHATIRIEEAESQDQLSSPLLKAIEQWLVALGSLLVLAVTLRFLGLYAPLVALLQIPLLTIGHLQLSLASLINVALIVVATVLSIRLLKALLNAKIYPALDVDVGVAYAINTLINYALFVVAFILSLVALGVQLSAVMVVVASLGVGIGFGLQSIAENLVSGFILLFGRAVKKGDFITVNDVYGRVEAVGARSVVLRTNDNFSMLIPSKEIVSGEIVNWTFQDSIVRIHVPIGVSYDADPTEVRNVLMETADRHPDVLDEPEPDVWLTEFGDSSIVFELLVHIDCRTTTERSLKGKFNFLLWEALEEADIDIPFPQRDLHLRTAGGGPWPSANESDSDDE